jgi:hypothetical protein
MATLVETHRLADIPTRAELRYTERFNQKWMEEQRFVGDPVADDVIRALAERFPIAEPEDLLLEVIRLAAKEGGVFQAFLDACQHVPEWADFEAMEPGMRLMATSGPILGLSILGGGVAGSAFHVRAEPVFTHTGRFVVQGGVAQRLVETGAILGLVPFEGEIKPGGRHHRIVVKVRLLHGAIRHWIALKDDTDEVFPYERCGIPINQEDLGYATLIFSYLSVRGMLRLGVQPSDEQIESLHLLWRYICYGIGASEDWLTETVGEQKVMAMALLKHLAEPDVASVAALNLLDGAMEAAPRPLQGFLQRTMRELTAYLGGEEYLSALKLEATGSQLGLSLLKGLGQFWNFLYRAPGGEPLLYWWGMRSLRRRYSSFGTVSQGHGYGVITHSRDAIAQAMEDALRKVDAAN